MTRLAELIEGFKNIREDLKKRYTELTGLTRTSISLSFGEERVFVGDNIVATGALMGGDIPLAGKTVSLMVDNVMVATARTGKNGAYATSITVPYISPRAMTLNYILPAGASHLK
jgi:hypothetical protein